MPAGDYIGGEGGQPPVRPRFDVQFVSFGGVVEVVLPPVVELGGSEPVLPGFGYGRFAPFADPFYLGILPSGDFAYHPLRFIACLFDGEFSDLGDADSFWPTLDPTIQIVGLTSCLRNATG